MAVTSAVPPLSLVEWVAWRAFKKRAAENDGYNFL